MGEDLEMVVVNEGENLSNDNNNNNNNNNNNKNEQVPQTKHVLPHWVEIWSKVAIYISIIICVFFFVAFIVAYGLFTKTIHDRVNTIEETCSNGDDNVNLLKKPPRQKVQLFMYNISNPREYIIGKTANVYELGPYSMSLLPVRNNVVLTKSKGTVNFNLYNDITYIDDKSCPECDILSPLYVPNVPYLALFSNAQNEASLMLSLTCSAKQIKNISSPGTSPTYCLPAQYNTAANCICCSANPSSPYTCNNIISPTSRVGGLISWLAQYDNGFKVNSNINTGSTGFRLATGVYTPLIRKLVVSEVIYGTVSSLVGFLNAATAVRSSDFKTLYALSNTTNDLKDACSALCPTITQLKQSFAAHPTSPRSVNISCNGLVPSWEILNQTLKNEKRSLELRYLEGVDCKPFSVTLAINALLLLDATATKKCADGSTPSDTNPCCLKSYSSTSLGTGAGLGCHFWVNGLVQSRRVYSNDEAVEYLKPSPETEFYSGCASPDLKFQQHIWRGQSQFDGWFTPSNYKYPNMSWADPTIVKGGRAKTISGTMEQFYVNGYQAAVRSGRGITSNFGVYQLTNGNPKERESTIWSPFKLGVTPVKYDKNRKVDGLETNHFLPVTEKKTDPEDIEYLQRHGVIPYQNMNNLVYSLGGIPVIMSYPNFYQSDESMLTQSNNLDKKTSSKAGVTLYRTRDGYTSNSPTLSTPEPITVDVWDKYGEDNFRGYLDIEPATGLTLEGKIANQFSVYLWNCDPKLDSSCSLARNTTTRSLCYTNGMLPCSFSNVFTPRVMGSKVIPIYWLVTTPGAPTDASGDLVAGVNTRYALSVLVVFVPALTFFITLLLLYCLLHHAHNPHLSNNQHTQVPKDEKQAD